MHHCLTKFFYFKNIHVQGNIFKLTTFTKQFKFKKLNQHNEKIASMSVVSSDSTVQIKQDNLELKDSFSVLLTISTMGASKTSSNYKV